MSFSDSDSESDIERVSSVNSTKESFDVVPENKDYKFKLLSNIESSNVKFSYTLKKGKDLPYSVVLKG